MKVIIDEREEDLYYKCYSIVSLEGNSTYIQLFKQVLPLGDVLIRTDEDKDVMLIERKTFADLFASIKDGRYEEQSYRLMHTSEFPLHNVCYLLEGMFSQLKNIMEKKIIYSTFASLNYFKGFSVMKTSNVRESAEYIIWMANKIDRDFMKGKIPSYLLKNSILSREQCQENEKQNMETNEIKNADYCSVVKKVKKDNVTPENIGEIILCQIPGISSKTAIAIMKNYKSFPHFMEELKKNPSGFENIYCETTNGKNRKINKTSIDNIKKYLLETTEFIPLDNSSLDTNQEI
jgi:ERCC4-type nuclease